MKPAVFEYFAPRTVEAALDLLAENGDDGKVLAGGQSLVPAMNFRLELRPIPFLPSRHRKSCGTLAVCQNRPTLNWMAASCSFSEASGARLNPRSSASGPMGVP